jgi:TPR repeat protein
MHGHPRKVIESPLPVEELLRRAEAGDADCQYWAAMRFFQGEGVPKDPHKALQLCLQASEQWHVGSIAFLGYCRLHGIVVSRAVKDAVTFLRYAATQGDATAQRVLGTLYLRGEGVKKSARLALRWLERAAGQGDTDALVILGGVYHDGREVVQDDEKACRYYLRAAAAGSPVGQFMYGSFLMKGEGVGANTIEAFEQLDLAAAQGYREALEVQAHFAEYISFDPRQAAFGPFAIDHPLPIRRRTLALMEFLGRPCYQAMSRDLAEYLQNHPESEAIAAADIARLLQAAKGQGDVLMTFTDKLTPP